MAVLQTPAVQVTALVVAVIALISKELLFRYMLHEAERVRSALLIANAWHARSDAASSLVVAIGIIGSMAAGVCLILSRPLLSVLWWRGWVGLSDGMLCRICLIARWITTTPRSYACC